MDLSDALKAERDEVSRMVVMISRMEKAKERF